MSSPPERRSPARHGTPTPLNCPPSRLLWICLPALILVVAGALLVSFSGFQPPFQTVDVGWYRLMLDSRTPWLTQIHLVLNFVGNQGMVIYCCVLFLVLLWRRRRRLALFVAGANLLVLGLTHLLKFLVARPRPENRLVQVDSGSYPSGHVSATVAAALVTAVVFGRIWIWISGTLVGVAMMYSRTYLGAHWVSDTIAGAILAIGVPLLLWAGCRDKYLKGNIAAPIRRAS